MVGTSNQSVPEIPNEQIYNMDKTDIPNMIFPIIFIWNIPNYIPPLSQKGFWDEPQSLRKWDPGQGARESPKTPWQLRVL